MRWKLIGMGGVTIALAGCDVPPEGTTAEDVSRYLNAVASIGCEMRSESDYLPVELQAGLTRQQALDITGYYIATQKAERLENGAVRVKAGPCAAGAA